MQKNLCQSVSFHLQTIDFMTSINWIINEIAKWNCYNSSKKTRR